MLAKKLDQRLNQLLAENANSQSASIKDLHNPDYDRQYAEDLLYQTIGPLTPHPRWAATWTSKSDPPSDFVPGGPAPQWNQEEVVMAMAGDPNMLFKSSGNPHSPGYGHQGGAPIFRMAKKVARIYNRANDKQFISDMYGNGLVQLSRMMQPGYDESRSPFISYVSRDIIGAMENGLGGSKQGIRAAGGDSTTGLRGLQSVLASSDPAEIRQMAEQVKGKYQKTRSHDKHDDNPFGQYSSKFYQLANLYADAIEKGDPDRIEAAKSQIDQLSQEIEDDATLIPGASSGMGSAINTGDRKSHVGVMSMDYKKDDDSDSISSSLGVDDNADSWVDPETITHILDIAINYDIGKLLNKSAKFRKIADTMGIKGGFGGPMTANELRYTVRTLGVLGSNYPGRGKMRSKLRVARDANGWWLPGEDPEMEPIPNSKEIWRSQWVRNDYRTQNPKEEGQTGMGSTEIAKEMNDEVAEFHKLGIATARKTVSKVSVTNTYKSALVKLQIIKMAEKGHLGIDEELHKEFTAQGIITEEVSRVDAELVMEAFDYVIRRIRTAIISEAVPNYARVASTTKLSDAYTLAWGLRNRKKSSK